MKNNPNFFERIKQISDYKGFNSINDFAINGLNYKSSEKINRLRVGDKYPSVEILLDITNKFEEIEGGWLLTGKGKMLKARCDVSDNLSIVSEPSVPYGINWKDKCIELQEEVMNLQKMIIRMQGDQKN